MKLTFWRSRPASLSDEDIKRIADRIFVSGPFFDHLVTNFVSPMLMDDIANAHRRILALEVEVERLRQKVKASP